MLTGHEACLGTLEKMDTEANTDRCRGLMLVVLGLAVALGLGMLSASIAVADEVPAAVSDRAASLRRLEDSRAQATAQQSSLEAQLAGHASVIQQLKAAGATDRLQKELAASQQLAQTLDVLAGHIRELDVQLGAQRRALVDAIDRELARGDEALTADARTSLGALRAETAAKLSQGAAKIVIRAPKMGKLDDPSDLLEKAALLRDSEQKLRRQAGLLAKRADGMDKRQKLRKAQERASDDLFADDSPRRRAAATVKAGGASDAAARTPTAGETKVNDPTSFQAGGQPPVAAPAPGVSGTVDTTPQSATNGGGNLGALKTATDIATIESLVGRSAGRPQGRARPGHAERAARGPGRRRPSPHHQGAAPRQALARAAGRRAGQAAGRDAPPRQRAAPEPEEVACSAPPPHAACWRCRSRASPSRARPA